MKPPRSLVLITIDCLRADHVGHLGYERPTTPFLDCLAAEALVFRNAIAAGAPTYYSLPAILASRYPLALGRDLIGLAPGESTLASVLRDYGFATAAFSAANPYISPRFGYDQGFDTFCDFLQGDGFASGEVPAVSAPSRTNQLLARTCHALPGLGAVYDGLYFEYCQRKPLQKPESLDALRRFPSAEVIVKRATQWLEKNSDRPFFLWLHLMDPHAPYVPKAEALDLMGTEQMTPAQVQYLNSYWARGDLNQKRLAKKRCEIVSLYDAGIRWADEQIRKLTEKLVELNVWDRCAVAITADHGEEFLDHGERFHAPSGLAKELVHVPLVLRVPGVPQCQLESATSLLDLAPTLLDAFHLPAPSEFCGKSCWADLPTFGNERPVITESLRGCTNPFHPENRNGPRILAVRQGTFKLVLDFSSGVEQLFDLQSDPQERMPLPLTGPPNVRRELLQVARKHLAESHQSRDFDRRNSALLRDLRLEWAHPAASVPN